MVITIMGRMDLENIKRWFKKYCRELEEIKERERNAVINYAKEIGLDTSSVKRWIEEYGIYTVFEVFQQVRRRGLRLSEKKFEGWCKQYSKLALPSIKRWVLRLTFLYYPIKSLREDSSIASQIYELIGDIFLLLPFSLYNDLPLCQQILSSYLIERGEVRKPANNPPIWLINKKIEEIWRKLPLLLREYEMD